MTGNEQKIKESFSVQASGFEKYHLLNGKSEFLKYTIDCLSLSGSEKALDVCAGTCAFARAMAPHCLISAAVDITPEMLAEGKKLSENEKLDNMLFITGNAYELPFPDNSFDTVTTRLSFHHLVSPEKVFREMKRVLKPSGKLAVIDMYAPDNSEAHAARDRYEILRDPSHVRTLTRSELLSLFADNSISVLKTDTAAFNVTTDDWFNLTKAPSEVRAAILSAMQSDLSGGPTSGFELFYDNDQLSFRQRWMMIIGEKE